MFCKCGCGEKTTTAKRNRKERGWVKGKPIPFIHGHNNRDKKHSQETLLLMSRIHKGKVYSPETIFKKGHLVPDEIRKKISAKNTGKPGPNRGRKMSESTKKKLSLSLTGTHLKERRLSPGIYGDKHWNWKGGKTPEISKLRKMGEYREWRDFVYKRDYWTCVFCKTKGREITAHHLKSFTNFPELRFEVSNGITLCRRCHIKIHSGNGGWTRGSRTIHDLKNPRTAISIWWDDADHG